MKIKIVTTLIILFIITEIITAQSQNPPQRVNSNNKNNNNNNQQQETQVTPAPPKKLHYNLIHEFTKRIKDKNYADILIKNYTYKENRIYIANTVIFIDTIIILPEQEKIIYAKIPITQLFDLKIIKENNQSTNKIIITTKGTGITTTLIIITDTGKSYKFLLKANKQNSDTNPDLAINIKDKNNFDFNDDNLVSNITNNNKTILNSNSTNEITETKRIYTIEDLKKGINPNPKQLNDYLSIIDKLTPQQLENINLINSDYMIYTNPNLDNPIRIFDDGRFTYFKFKNEPNLNGIKLPAILSIENDIEEPTNIQTYKNYLIVKSINKQYILKVDKEYICIEKIKIIVQRKEKRK